MEAVGVPPADAKIIAELMTRADVTLLVEIAGVTPPPGFNLFVLQTMSGKDSAYVARASIPFFFMMAQAIVLIIVFPAIVTWLPEVLIRKSGG